MFRKFICAISLFAFFHFVAVAYCAEKQTPSGSQQEPEIFVQLGHRSHIGNVKFSPNGKYLASSGFNIRDQKIKLWELATGRELRTIWTNIESISALDFSPDSRLLVVAGSVNSVTLCNIDDGGQTKTLPIGAKDDIAYDVAFSPDGKVIAVSAFNRADTAEQSIRLLDVKTGKIIRKMGETAGGRIIGISRIAFSPDGKYLLSGCNPLHRYYGAETLTLRFWDVKTGREMRKLGSLSTEETGHLAFAPGGNQVALTDRGYNITLWNTGTGQKKIIGKAYGHQAAFSPDGKSIAFYSKDNLILHDIATGKDMNLREDGLRISPGGSVQFSPDGRYLAFSNGSGILIRDITSEKIIRKLGGNVELLDRSYFSADGGKINITGYGGLQSFDIIRGGLSGSNNIIPLPPPFYYLPDHDEEYWLVNAQRDRKIIRLSLGAYERIDNLSPDGRLILRGNDKENNLKIFDFRKKRLVATLENSPPAYAGNNSWFSPDGNLLAASGRDREGRSYTGLWNTSTGRQIKKIYGYAGLAVFTADGRQMITGSFDGNLPVIRTWDIETGREVKALRGHSAAVSALALSGDEKYLLSGDGEGKIKLWNFQTGREMKTLTDSATGEEIKSLTFSADNSLILATTADNTTTLWNATSGRELARFICFKRGNWIVITPEGYYNASPGGDQYLNVRIGNNVYGIENYREAFFRPDLLKLALSGRSLRDFRKLADVKQPPVVKIVKPPAIVAGDEVTVHLSLTDQGGGIGDIRLYLNGTAVVMDSRAVRITAKNTTTLYKEYGLKLASGKNIIKAVAFNGDNSMQSNEAVWEVNATYRQAGKPSLYALVIGIDEFKNPKLKLQYPAADADLFATTLRNGSAELFDKVTIKKLTKPEETTNTAILHAIKSLQPLRPDDLFVFYIASHGTVEEGEYFLITSNVGSLRTEKLRTDAISQHQLKEAVANIPATKKLIIIDTCNAGALGEAIQVAMLTRGMSEDTALKILSRAVGSTILSASTSLQEALEGYKGHGLFTYVLAEGLKGKADKLKTGYIKTTELADYVDNEVPQLAEKVFKRAQYPTISISGQAFPIGKIK